MYKLHIVRKLVFLKSKYKHTLFWIIIYTLSCIQKYVSAYVVLRVCIEGWLKAPPQRQVVLLPCKMHLTFNSNNNILTILLKNSILHTLCPLNLPKLAHLPKLRGLQGYFFTPLYIYSQLSSLAILSIKNAVAKEIYFDESFSKFADNKVRKLRF